MSEFIILADASCDLSEAFQKEYDIRIIHGHLVYPGKVEKMSFLSWTEEEKTAFYQELKRCPDEFATSPSSAGEYRDAFLAAADGGCTDILSVHLSSGISGAYDFALQGKALALEERPDLRIRCIDSMRFGPGFGLLVVHAAEHRKNGASMEETAAYIEENKNRYHQAGWLDDLSFVAKKGRITHSKAFFGTLAGVKPLGEFDYNGLTTVIGRTTGAKNAYAALLSYMEETGENLSGQVIFIAQTNRRPQAEEFKRLIEGKFHPKAVYVNDVFPTCAINIGPGLMAAYYVGKPISSDLSEEKAIMEKAVRNVK